MVYVWKVKYREMINSGKCYEKEIERIFVTTTNSIGEIEEKMRIDNLIRTYRSIKVLEAHFLGEAENLSTYQQCDDGRWIAA